MKLEPITEQNKTLLRDESRIQGTATEILWPENAEEAIQAIRCAVQQQKKVTFRGAATGLMGGAVPQGGELVDFSRLTQLGEIHVDSGTEAAMVLAECGVTLDELDRQAGAEGLCFPVGPTEKSATLGGVFASGAAGPNSLFYGRTSHFVRTLNWVTPQGESWRISRGSYRISNGKLPLPNGRTLNLPTAAMPFELWQEGMDLIDFLSGTEGYFGAAISMELTLIPKPGDLWGVVFFFRKFESASAFAKALLPRETREKESAHVTLAEFFNRTALELLAQAKENPLLAKIPPFPQNAAAAIYVEMEAPQEGLCADLLMDLLDLFESCGGREEDTWSENGAAGVQRFRDMRHALPALLNELPEIHSPELGYRWETDFAGKPQQFEQYLQLCTDLLQKYRLRGAVYGHLLQNQLRLALLPDSEQSRNACPHLVQDMAEQVMEWGGRAASEYGVGRVNRPLADIILSEDAKEQLRALCRAFDPAERMNP